MENLSAIPFPLPNALRPNPATQKKMPFFTNLHIARLLIFFLSLFYGLSNAHGQSTRIITYNIMDGFNYGKDTARQVKVAKWLKAKQPKIVALQELCDYSTERLSKEAAQWGHPYVALLKTSGYSVGLTSDSPIKIIEKKTEGLWHGMLHVQVSGINVFVVHLSPSDYKIRRKEADTILNRVQKCLALNQECIVLGDFNSSSPFDDDNNKKHPELLNSNIEMDAKSNTFKHLANDYFDYSVIGKFLATPMIDVCQRNVAPERRYSYSTPLLIPRYRKDLDAVLKKRERMDYIFVSPELGKKCKKAWIANDESTGLLSDHYPVIADFDL